MLTEYIAAGEIDQDGRLQLSAGKEEFARGMRSMKRRMKVEVIVREAKSRRSNAANRYYWGVVLKLIADYTGDDVNSIHEFVKMKFLRPREIRILGETFAAPASSSELDSQQFHEFVEQVRKFAATELSIETPEPDHEWFKHRERKHRAA